MDTAPRAIRVGERFTLDEVEYVINRVTTQSKDEMPLRLQIDCIPVAEVVRRHNNLKLLLAGVPADSE